MAKKKKYTIIGIYKDNDDQVFGDDQYATSALKAAKQSVIDYEEGDLRIVEVMTLNHGRLECGLLNNENPMSREDLGVFRCEDCEAMYETTENNQEEVCEACLKKRQEEESENATG